MRRLIKIAVGSVLSTTFVLGVFALSAPAHARFGGGNCICPDVYAPVTCSDGRTYPNACVASCNHATDCVRGDTI